MFRLPSWISESTCYDKVVNGEVDQKMANATRPVVEIVSGGDKKRKRVDVPELVQVGLHEAKRRKQELPLTAPTSPSEAIKMDVATDSAGRSGWIHEIIESQFSLDILLKHNELRLINQELAKCQVALEQLRRCHLIPYPVSSNTVESRLSVTNGTGPAVGKDNVPAWAPPFGVTDGPYTRHYAKWLIPDPSFDGGYVERSGGSQDSRIGKTVLEGRSTRNSFAESTPTANKSRSYRGSAGHKLQALSSGYPQTKDKAGPCILKRGDGQMVKLVCVDCHRENFSSPQGYINHCRIAHHRDYKSHEEAAVASGQPIEVDESGGIVGEEKSPTVANGLVHPLIRSTPTDKDAYRALLSHIKSSMELFNQGKLPGVTSIPTSVTSTPSKPVTLSNRNFVSSSATPHLSELLRLKGFDGNLEDIVGDAKQKVDFDELSSHDEDSDVDDKKPYLGLDGARSPPPVMRIPARAGVTPAPLGRPASSKGMSGISPRLSHATPVLNTTSHHHRPTSHLQETFDTSAENHSTDIDMDIRVQSMVDLSPNTVGSNNAPSLVSDDGEYDDGEDVESASEVEEDEESDVAEINIEDEVVPRTVLRNRAGSGGEGMKLRKENNHVTFVSPVKEAGKERRNRRL